MIKGCEENPKELIKKDMELAEILFEEINKLVVDMKSAIDDNNEHIDDDDKE